MSDHSRQDHFSKAEIGKDAVQSTVEAAAETAGQVARIITKAVQEVVGAVGGFATEIYEIRDAARKASDEQAGLGAAGPSAVDVDPSESS
jgi:hypothetical protein